MTRRPALLALVLLACPASAAASTVTTPRPACDESAEKYMQCFEDLVVRGGPGEANAFEIRRIGPRTEIRDAGARLTEQSPMCEPLPDGAVSCEPVGGTSRLLAGDGDDRVQLDAPGWSASGGTGDDLLTGGPQGDLLDGGPGRDVLRGGAGDDLLVDGERDGTEVAPDRIDGGAGRDTVSYVLRRDGLRVDLVTGDAAEDTVTAVENVDGGRGADRLRGDEGPNRLEGSNGDVVEGRGGDDVLVIAGSGGARLSGGAGDDTFERRGGVAVRIDCGPGRDLVTAVARFDVLTRSCEVVRDGLGAEARLTPRSIAVSAGGRGLAWLRTTGPRPRDLGRRVLPGVPPRALRLNAAGRALARRPGTALVALEIRRSGGFGEPMRFRLRL